MTDGGIKVSADNLKMWMREEARNTYRIMKDNQENKVTDAIHKLQKLMGEFNLAKADMISEVFNGRSKCIDFLDGQLSQFNKKIEEIESKLITQMC